MRSAAIVAFFVLLLPAGARLGHAKEPARQTSLSAVMTRQAKKFFERFQKLEHAFDPAVADLYADDAVIKNKRIYPHGMVRHLTFPAPKYKELIRSTMPLAKARNDKSLYRKCKYKAKGTRVTITCQRFSTSKRYTSPYKLVVGPGKEKGWLIFEEHSVSRP